MKSKATACIQVSCCPAKPRAIPKLGPLHGVQINPNMNPVNHSLLKKRICFQMLDGTLELLRRLKFSLDDSLVNEELFSDFLASFDVHLDNKIVSRS